MLEVFQVKIEERNYNFCKTHVSKSFRPVREDISDAKWKEIEKEEDVNKKVHIKSILQRVPDI